MSDHYSIRPIEKNEWLQLAPKCNTYNYRQSWAFGSACALRLNAVCEHIAIQKPNGVIVSLADVRIKKIPFLGGGIAYINGGPLMLLCNDYNEEIFTKTISAVTNEYNTKRGLTLRIAPPPRADERKKDIDFLYLNLGFTNTNQEKKTLFLDLSLELSVIRKNLHQKWRNCLNKSEKSNIKLLSGKETSDFKKFIPLFNELIVDKNFSVDLDIDFYKNVQQKSVDFEKFIVTIAEIDGEAIAGHVSSILGDTCIYLLGASNSVGRKVNAAYLLQWNAITMAKSVGCLWYDLGGIDQEENPGVYRFKKRVGGLEIDVPGPFEINASGFRSTTTMLAEKTYHYFKKVLKQIS